MHYLWGQTVDTCKGLDLDRCQKIGRNRPSRLSYFEDEVRATQKKIIRKKFNIGYLEGHHLHQMTKILLRLDDGDRLSEKNVVWLSTNATFSNIQR